MPNQVIDRNWFLPAEVHAYVGAQVCVDKVQESLIKATDDLGPAAIMQIAPDQGAFMTMLARLTGAKNAIEVGTFTGYSSLCIARGLVEDGRLITCDLNEEWTSVARKHWEMDNIAHKIDLRIGPAVETLQALALDPIFDFAFIDADKGAYPIYYEEILKRLKPGGLIIFDNVLIFGTVLEENPSNPDARVMRALNDRLKEDNRVDTVMLSIADGLTLARKKTT